LLTVRRQGFFGNGLGKLREALAHQFGGFRRPAAGAASGGWRGLSFDPFSFCQDGVTPPSVDVGRGEIVDALVVAPVVVVSNEGGNLSLEITGQEVVFQQDAVLERLVPTLDLALGHLMIGRAAKGV
jgi:hypothetical protein